ncbi:MAG TPA: HAMP domain-containing sensor histidine kinase [bacterium]|nr:HAMP domain-containing sensor histidine kinase [bacterium]
MISRHLILKLYLWILLALTLSVAGAAFVVALLSQHDIEQRAQEWVLAEVRPSRDVVQNLLQSGMTLPELREVLEPLRRTARVRLQVLAPDGTPVLSFPPPLVRHGPPEMPRVQRLLPPLDPALLSKVLAGQEVLDWRQRDHLLAALPIRLPDGRPGAFYLSARRFHWEREGVPWRLLAGLAAVLLTLWLLSWPLAGHLARPLQRMAAAADALGQGHLSVRINPEDIQRRHQHWKRRDEIARLAESFNRMAENLQRLVLRHKQLLADISHELRSPLARLRLALELARGAEGAEQARYLDTLERQADTMESLIGELLFHARLDEAPYALQAEPLDLAALVAEAVAGQRPEAEAKRLTVRVHVPERLANVRADRRLLARALGNALRNAVTYSPDEGAVDVTVRREEGRHSIAVRDEGPGVPAEQLERIFEPFVRTDAARGRATGGVGLGLSIVRRCMEAHGGGASAQAADGRGLVVTLWLPAEAQG